MLADNGDGADESAGPLRYPIAAFSRSAAMRLLLQATNHGYYCLEKTGFVSGTNAWEFSYYGICMFLQMR